MATANTIPSVYDHSRTETKWYDYWLEKGYFTAHAGSGKPPYTIVIPPPNVTGSLHIGHALVNSIQDVLIRYHRMKGYEALWLPGTDHASIGTEVKIEEALTKEGTTRQALGREKFLERAWQWKAMYGDQIINQLKRLGASCDWTRTRFTMDEGLSRAVLEVFVRLYEEGLIYRGDYITNWCPDCQTVISDLEVEHEDTQGNLWYMSYPYEDGNGSIVVATTRPETIPGDTAVAVNPEDSRYKDAVGRYVILPVLGRRIPVIADSYVDMEFGTGAVKVTPSHDPNDFEMMLRHKLPKITVIGKDGKMTADSGPYAGLDRYECRKRLVADFAEAGNLVKIENHSLSVGRHDRCNTVVEPLVTTQWFVQMKPLAGPAIAAVKYGKVKFVPERFTKVYMNWMENIRPWCISRQLWWGHRIPAYYCKDCGEIMVAVSAPATCTKCGSANIEQDPDVLDTWFSSALWPYSTLGWPEETEDLAYFYPTNVLVTGYDIIFFWVARMIFTGLHFMAEKPFSDVVMNGLVLDKFGKKMSRSKGTGVDPLEAIDEFGADALRFALLTGTAMGYDSRFYREKIESARNFANKIWNASRFVMMNLDGEKPEPQSELDIADRWILSRLSLVTKTADTMIQNYEIGEAAKLLYDFIWSEFCDWYIEMSKPRLLGPDESKKKTAQYVLWYVLEHTLRLLHPYMPFITEEIWQALPHDGESISIASWPSVEYEVDAPLVSSMTYVMDATRAIRNLRAELGVQPGKKVACVLHASPLALDSLKATVGYVERLAGVSELEIAGTGAAKPRKAVTAVVPEVQVFIPFEGLIDIAREIERLSKDLDAVLLDLAKVDKRLGNAGFTEKAPKEVVEKELARKEEMTLRVGKIQERLALLKE